MPMPNARIAPGRARTRGQVELRDLVEEVHGAGRRIRDRRVQALLAQLHDPPAALGRGKIYDPRGTGREHRALAGPEHEADLRQPARAAADFGPRRASAGRTAAGEQALLDRARALNAAHWQAHGRQISRDKLRAALGVGATRAERLLAALAAEPPTGSPPADRPEPAPPGAARSR